MRRRSLWGLFSLVAVSTALAGAPRSGIGDPLLPDAGNLGYDVQHYTLDLTVTDVDDGEMRAATTIEFVATQDVPDFNVDFTDLNILVVQLNDEPTHYDYERGELTILPDAPLETGETYSLMIAYTGDPDRVRNPIIGDSGWTTYSDGIYVAGEPFSATSFMPVNDHPRDKATYTIRVTVPQPYMGVSNGVLIETIEGDDTTTTMWEMRQPMASYLITVGVGEFEVQTQEGEDGLPITNYFPQDANRDIISAFRRQPEIIAFLSEVFGPYPFDTAGSLVVDDPRMGFALETQSLPIYAAGMVEFAQEYVVVHELAHQWFGNSVSLYNWNDIWLNEGFASYAEALWAEYSDGNAAYRRYLREYYTTARFDDTPPGAPGLENLFTGSVYHRGALTLHALRYNVGDELFFDILRAYTERYQYSNATTDDFIAIAEEIADKPLDDLFNDWLFGDDLPSLASIGLN